MNKRKMPKSLCAILLTLAILVAQIPSPLFLVAATGDPAVAIDNCGSRLNAVISNIDSPVYCWQISDTADGTFEDIENANEKYYDITTADEGKYIKAVVNGIESSVVGPIGKLVVFDLSLGSVTFGTTYSGNNGTVTGTHIGSNIYVVTQSNIATYSTNTIKFSGTNSEIYDVTISGVHLGSEPVTGKAPNSQGIGTYSQGVIDLQPSGGVGSKNVILRLKGENIVRAIHYYTNGSASTSSLKITDINGDNATDGGSLYIPVKVEPDEIDQFVNSNLSYNHWNSGIGGDDGSGDRVTNFEIAGGKLQVLTTYADNCTAIGAGGNGPCTMTISGGDITAHCNGTGTAIGGGIGWFSHGGTSNITVSGGKVYAKNHGQIYVNGSKITTQDKPYDKVVGGVAIGSGSSFEAAGSEGKVTITGGYVEAYGTFGNGIGGGNSSSSTGGKATINISGGTVIASSIGGGDSKNGTGGAANVEVSGTADITLVKGIGGGTSLSGNGGAATITVKGGTMTAGGSIGGGEGGGTGNGGDATVHIYGGNLIAASIGGGIGSVGGHGGAAIVKVTNGVIETGSIGGGKTNNPNGQLGYAKAVIDGGDISGQFLMAAGGTEACSFTMTGGILHGVNTADTSKFTYAQQNGAAVYMDDPNGIVNISGGTIEDCSANNGGAIYMSAGTMTVNGGTIKNNTATVNGGAVYLGGGTLTVSNGVISGNSAKDNGGAAYINGGNVYVSGGSVSGNTATNNGGGIAVNNGNYKMTGGNVDDNKALEASGGGIYVSANETNVVVDVLSGSVSGNSANVSGGALAVVGKEDGTENIQVTIGVDKEHYDAEGNRITTCEHGASDAFTCPVVENNLAEVSGGAIYVTGNTNTILNIYCLQESGSQANGENGQSDCMKMEGGSVTITTSDCMDEDDEDSQTAKNGNTQIENTIYVTGGQMDIWGEMTNPRIEEIITVDIEKEGDYFDDHRKEKEYYKLLYYENFTDPITGITTGQYKEKEIPIGSTVTIDGNIYSHPGYDIVGWNTHPKGDHNYEQGYDGENPTWGWYEVGEDYVFDGNPIGDLVIYAIWEANGYTVVYDPNVPQNESYTGIMENQIFKYDMPISLLKNTYGRPGYNFAGWSRNPDGTGERYADEQTVTNLTTKKGEVVTLYAIWEKCDHNPEKHEYIYSVTNNGATLRRDCECGKYSETVDLSAEDTIYDMEKHPAQVMYSSDWKPEITYTVEDSQINEEVSMDGVPIYAGTYTASVSAGGKTAKVTYVIEKAEQPAPVKPIEYEAEIYKENNSSTLKIKPIAESPKKQEDTTYDSYDEYQIVYYVGDEKQETEWVKGTVIDGEFAAEFALEVALTNYYIYARYSEGTNYKASPATPADTVYFFAGEVEVHVSCGEGVTYVLEVADGTEEAVNGIRIQIATQEGYYFPKDYAVTSETKNSEQSAVLEEKSRFSIYEISQIPKSCEIYITLPDALKEASIDAKITEKQVFGRVTTSQATISRDSAYTAYFEVLHYNQDEYLPLTLEFSASLPVGTKLIMLDKAQNDYYWLVIDVEKMEINLSEFVRMGAEIKSENKYVNIDEERKLQFVVDFSGCEDTLSVESLTTTLTAEKQEGSNAETAAKGALTQLEKESNYSLLTGGTGLTQTVTHTIVESEGVVSKWDDRHTALVLSSQRELPSDAHLVYYDGTYTTVVYANGEEKFVLPMFEVSSGNMDITLVSESLSTVSAEEYVFDVKWVIAESIAETSPMNGDVVAQTEIKFVSEVILLPAVKVAGDDRLYTSDESVNATVKWENIPKGNDLTVTLMRKSDNGEYINTGWEKDIEVEVGNRLEFPVSLGGQKAGSYCLQATVMSGLVKVTEAYYYFIIE